MQSSAEAEFAANENQSPNIEDVHQIESNIKAKTAEPEEEVKLKKEADCSSEEEEEK